MPRLVDKKAKRRQILKAALKVFARQGIYDFKVIEIARAASVGKGTLYEYFPSKNDLIVGCFTEFMAEFDEYVTSQVARQTDPAEKVRRLVSATFEFCLADPAPLEALFHFYAAGISGRDGKPLLAEMTPMYRQMISRVAVIVDEGISQGVFRPTDSKLAASLILALLDGVFFQVALGVIRTDDDDFATRISHLLLEGLLEHRHERP